MPSRFAGIANEAALAFYESLPPDERIAFSMLWDAMARPGQRPPSGDWRTWLLMAGRGFGKTRAGAEWIAEQAAGNGKLRIALVAATMAEARAVMVEGESGILSVVAEGGRPDWRASLGQLVWKSGAQAFIYSGANPELLRGPQHHVAWCDEIAKWACPRETWDNLQFGLRLGAVPRVLVTTTPRPVPLLRALLSDGNVAVTRGSTRDNVHLPGAFLDAMVAQYAGTRLGRQELDGELIEDVEGALWTRDMIEACRVREAAELVRVVIGVDPPAGTVSGSGGDVCGIIVCGLGRDGIGYVIDDASVAVRAPQDWALAVAQAAARHGADRVVAEANNGGKMVETVLRAADSGLPVRLVHASRGKAARAEPVALLYAAGKVRHIGAFPALEDELCGLISGGGYEGPGRSPDRADACVWGLSEFMLGKVRAGPRVRLARDIAPLETTATSLAVAYLDPARDYQAGLQRARRDGPGVRDERVDLPATLDAAGAHGIAVRALARRNTERRRATIVMPWRALTARPGDRIAVADEDWRVAELRFERMTMQLDLVRAEPDAVTTAATDPGRNIAQVDAIHGATTLAVLDMPQLSDAIVTTPLVGVVAAGTSAGWRRASLLASTDAGASFVPVGTTALPATMGLTATVLAAGPLGLADRINAVEIVLLNPAMVLADADMAALTAGTNRALIGGEVIQFGRAQPISPGRWRLSELWRGRRGTEDAVVPHPTGTPFVLIEESTILALPAAQAVGGVQVMAAGIGDSEPLPTADCPTAGRALMPLSPVHATSSRLPSGDTVIAWTRRSRGGWGWRDGIDAPLGEEREAYRVDWTGGSSEVSQAAFTYPAAARAADLAVGMTVRPFSIRQSGDAALSPPLNFTIDLN